MPGPRTRSATVRVVDDRPKRPKVDSGDEFEGLVRLMFKPKVEAWVKENLKEKLPKDVVGNVIDNLTAQWTSALETTVDAATDTYLSTTEEGDDEIDCPHCEAVFEIPEGPDGELVPVGTMLQCPECRKAFPLPDEEDDGNDPDGGERATGS